MYMYMYCTFKIYTYIIHVHLHVLFTVHIHICINLLCFICSHYLCLYSVHVLFALIIIQEVLAELQIPFHAIQGTKKPSIVQYCVQKALYRFLFNREGLLTKCTIIDKPVAKKLIDHGYKQLSKFGYWCPVKVMHAIIML